MNALGQRANLSQTGTDFATARTVAWGYDPLGQVTNADSSTAAQDRAYEFDLIGNRLSGGDLGSPISYMPNALNQYTTIGTLNPVHDADGNMTSGPLPANVNANSTLVWDGENRLIEAQVTGGGTATYLYDSQSRRIATISAAVTMLTIYDGWNPMAEYSISNNQYSISKSFTWGIDLSGSIQGAGGVGGLLMVSEISNSQISNYFPTFDGNGNVSEYLDSAGNVVAHYEYDPFGKITVATGSKANDFAHRFSTKPLDTATGLYYYGYRFYDPETGRWPSRDPIGENGGMNLYGMVENDSVNWIDHLGLFALMYCTRCKDGDGSMLCTIWEWDSRDDAFAGKLPPKTHITETTNKGPNTEPDKGTGRNGSDDPYGSMGPVPPGVYDVLPRKSKGGTYPLGTPSITDRGGKAEPGSITTPGGTPRSHLYIHGEGRSDGCLTCKGPDDVKEIMDDNSGKGGMMLWIKEVCCDKGAKTPSVSNDEFY